MIDAYTNLKDIDNSVNYVTLEPRYIAPRQTSVVVPCIEGFLVECETDNNNIISLANLDDNNRYFFPETHVATNGIFISNLVIRDSAIAEGELWQRVDNLNTQLLDKKVFKFGYDAQKNLPYIQFPEDIGSLIEDGLRIRYIRTNGVNGNISVNTLRTMEKPLSWSEVTSASSEGESDTSAEYLDVENYLVTNLTAAKNGSDPETIDSAYFNYKKIIGTFDTLVTCRDYMNYIYMMTQEDSQNTPIVSNIIVSDIRDDINRAHTLCTRSASGIEYRSLANKEEATEKVTITDADGNTHSGTLPRASARINHFDLVLYPFVTASGQNTAAELRRSFTYKVPDIQYLNKALSDVKTMAHNFIAPADTDIVCIKNYYELAASINTIQKVTDAEASEIEANVHRALYKAFNMRNMEFGEELPYNTILSVLTKADPRIKSVYLEDPKLKSVILTAEGNEYPILDLDDSNETSSNLSSLKNLLSSDISSSLKLLSNLEMQNIKKSLGLTDAEAKALFDTWNGKVGYNKLVLNNVLAGRVPAFEYDTTFDTNYDEKDTVYQYQLLDSSADNNNTNTTGPTSTNTIILGDTQSNATQEQASTFALRRTAAVAAQQGPESAQLSAPIKGIKAECKIDISVLNDPEKCEKGLTLKGGEVVKFRAPSLKTIKTYPAYVNYYLDLPTLEESKVDGVPATFQTLLDFMNGNTDLTPYEDQKNYWGPTPSWQEKLQNMADFFAEDFTSKTGILNLTTAGFINNEFETPAAYVLYSAEETTRGWYGITQAMIEKAKTELTGGTANDSENLRNFSANMNVLAAAVNKFYGVTTTFNFGNDLEAEAELSAGNWTIYWLDKINTTNFGSWHRWLTSKDISEILRVNTNESDLNKAKLCIDTTDYKKFEDEFKLQGLYRSINTSIDTPYGKLIDKSYHRYNLITTAGAGALSLDSVWVPMLWEENTAEHTRNGLGQDAVLSEVPVNNTYVLKKGEHLWVNYTSSEGRSDGQAVQINCCYGEGTILKANFALQDSETRSAIKKFSKSLDSKAQWVDSEGAPVPESGPLSMYTLGTSEKIEVLDFIKVTLDDTLNIYWIRNDKKLEFEFDEEFDGKAYTAYTLKDGEYFYYTDENKQDLAFAGSGTVIKKVGNFTLKKLQTDTAPTAEQIEELGLAAAIPWKAYALTKSNYLQIREYQYLSLVADDTLNTLEPVGPLANNLLTNQYVDVATATYTFATSSAPEVLPGILAEPDSQDNDKNPDLKWQASCSLELLAGPVSAQVLRANNIVSNTVILLKADPTAEDSSLVEMTSLAPSLPSESESESTIYIKTNQLVMGTETALDTDETEDSTSTDTTLLVKVFDKDEATSGSVLEQDNTGFLSLPWLIEGGDEDKTEAGISPELHVLIPQTHYAIVSMYYLGTDPRSSEAPALRVKINNEDQLAGNSDAIEILNQDKDKDNQNKVKWWPKADTDADTDDDRLGRLRSGLNTFLIKESCSLSLKVQHRKDAKLWVSKIQLVARDASDASLPQINQKLGYYSITKESAVEQLLSDIKYLDPELDLLYTSSTNTTLSLDLNINDPKDTLRVAKNWFDVNNINNKFVVAQLETRNKHLTKNVTVSKFSRK